MSDFSIFCLFVILGAILTLIVMIHRVILRIWIAVELIRRDIHEMAESTIRYNDRDL